MVVYINDNVMSSVRKATMELKDKAISLYQTHPASSIAKELGVSESTIRRWVKGVKKEKVKQYESLVNTILPLAIRPQGIKNKEEWNIYKDTFSGSVDEETGQYKVNITESQKSYIRSLVREKAKQSGNIALFVPDWLSTEQPRSSWESMLSMTNEMYDRMQEYLNGYMVEYDMPSDARWAVAQQLLVLLVPEYSPRSIYDVCKQATDVVDILEERIETKTCNNALPEEISSVFSSVKDIEHFIY